MSKQEETEPTFNQVCAIILILVLFSIICNVILFWLFMFIVFHPWVLIIPVAVVVVCGIKGIWEQYSVG